MGGSGASYDSYRGRIGKSKGLVSGDEKVRASAFAARVGRLERVRAVMGDDLPIPQRDTEGVYDEGSVKLGIKSPAAGVERVYVVCIDNSGSNQQVSRKLRQDSGYLTAFLNTLDPSSQIAFIYFSDHCDEPSGLMQEIDFASQDEDGDKVITSTLHHIRYADGGDPPEAIECVLWRVCDIDFASAKERHLILVTDVVAHEMGMRELGCHDDGCPRQRNWQQSLKKVGKTFTSFLVVGSGEDKEVGELQKQFVPKERVGLDLIDLSSIRSQALRLGMTANAILFLIARQRGKQAVEMFLSALYEKWLTEPLFGLDSETKAKEMIRRLAKFLEYPEAETEAMLKKVLAEEDSSKD